MGKWSYGNGLINYRTGDFEMLLEFIFEFCVFAVYFMVLCVIGIFSKGVVDFLYNLSPKFRGWVDTMVANVED